MCREFLKKRLTIGHNGNPEFTKIMDQYHEYIYEVYFAPAGWVMQSTRPNDRVYNYNYVKLIKEHYQYAKEKNYDIKFAIVLNSQCWNGDFRSKALVQRILDFMELLDYSFDDVTVSDEFLAHELKPYIPDKSFTTSIISALNEVDTCIEMLNQFPEFETICVGHKCTYNIEEIKRIKEVTGKKIKLLVNQGCYYNCPDYTLHSVALAHSTKYMEPIEEGKLLHCDYINSYNNESSWKNLTHQALSPAHLEYYKDCVDYFKISTRIEYDINRVSDIIGSYIAGDTKYFAKKLFMGGARSVSYEIAAIFSMVEYPENYIEVRNKCHNRCHSCNYCKKLWKEAEKKFYSLPEEKRPSREELFFREKPSNLPLYAK